MLSDAISFSYSSAEYGIGALKLKVNSRAVHCSVNCADFFEGGSRLFNLCPLQSIFRGIYEHVRGTAFVYRLMGRSHGATILPGILRRLPSQVRTLRSQAEDL